MSLGSIFRIILPAALCLSFAGAQVRDVVFDTNGTGVSKGIATWGLDTAWLSEVNVRRGVVFMGQPQVDVVRFSFTGDWPLVAGDLGTEAQAEFDARMAIVDNWTEADTALYLNNDTGTLDASFNNGDGVNAAAWAQLIDVTRQKCVAAGRTVLSVSLMNEPDYATWQGTVNRFGDVCWQLRNTYAANFVGIRLMGGNTLSNDQAASWYNTLNGWGYLEEGNTHQLAGSFDNYAAFYDTVQGNGDVGCNDELHNVAEAMIGAEHGMDSAIWWGAAERARGEFVQASDGARLAYAENRPYWTAASVYRAPGATKALKAFVGESERQSVAHNYQFISRDRPVFFDGHGPQHTYSVGTSGDWTYWSTAHRNAERVVNITWGDDVQPAIGGSYYITNRNSSKVMEVANSGTADGDNIQQNAYSAATNQRWNISALPLDSGGDYSYYAITNVNSGKAPDLFNFSLDAGGNVAQWGLPGTYPGVNQQWFFEYAGDGWFYIRNRWSGLYLDVNGASTSNGANIFQWSKNGNTNQQWRLIPVGSAFNFVAPATPTGLVATANDVSVSLSWNAVADTDLAGYTVLRSATSGGSYEVIARDVVGTTFVDSSANQTVPYYYVVRAQDQSLNRSANSTQATATPTGAAGLVAGLAFDGDLTDSTVNANHAQAHGTVSYGTGKVSGNSVVLDGTGSYLTLPSAIANHDTMTIATWVYWSGGSAWQRIFDFGNGEPQYLYLSPSSGAGTLRFAINSGTSEETIESSPLAVNQWVHVAVTLNGSTGILYVNGVQAASNTAMTISPADVAPVVNYIGKSQFSADPTFAGRLDDFRIYNHALSASEVAALVLDSTPPAAPTGLVATAGNGSVMLDWADNTESDFDSYTVYRSTTSGSGYTAIASGLTTSAYTDNSVAGGTQYFYVVTATDDSSNESAFSTEASASIPEVITLPNGDFDQGVTNLPGFDSPTDVPGWTNLNGTVIDSGVGGPGDWWGPYDQYAAFMATGDGAINMSSYTIKAGDEFDISFFASWWNWTGASGQWTVTLFYDTPSNVIGTYTSPALGSVWAHYETTAPITATPTSVGGTLGVIFESTGGGIAQLDEVELSVTSLPLTPAETWRQQHFGITTNTGNAADLADPDADGIPNLIERATSSDPNAASPAVVTIDTSGAPLSIVFNKSLAATDLTLTVEESPDLVSWTSSTGSTAELANDGTLQQLRFTRSTTTEPRLFLRVKVSAP